MSKKVKIALFVLSICLIVSAGVVAANYDIVQSYLMKDEAAVQQDLKGLSLEQLVNEVDGMAASFENTNNVNALIPFVSELVDRRDTLQDTEILNLIRDQSRTLTLREALIDIYTLKHENNPEEAGLKSLLTDQLVEHSLKARIVANTTFTTNDIELLKDLFLEDDGLLAFHSLKALRKVDKAVAYELSKAILADIPSAPKDKLTASLQATAYYLKNKQEVGLNDKQVEADFIELSLQLIQDSDEIYVKDSAFFSISELGSKEAIISILESEFIDRELKVFAVDQNFMVLHDMLLHAQSEADIAHVVTAMELLPIQDLIEGLTKVTESLTDDQLKKRSEAVLQLMKSEGIQGNHKWLENN